MALPTPPPTSPTGLGRLVKNSSDNECTPRETTSHNTENSGASATTTAAAHRPVMIVLVTARAR